MRALAESAMRRRLRDWVPTNQSSDSLDVDVPQGVKPGLLVAGLFALVGLVAVACGSDGGDLISVASDDLSARDGATDSPTLEPTVVRETSPLRRSDDGDGLVGEGSWVLGDVPDGFVPVLVRELEGQRAIFYQHESNLNDLLDSPLTVTVSLDGPGSSGIPGSDEVSLHGTEGFLLELHGDGEHYGTLILWQDAQERWVTVTWAELVPEDDVLALAAGAREIDDEEWDHLRRTLGSEAVIGGEVADAIEEVVVEGTSSTGLPYRLVALIPPDYPLDANDRRPMCYRLDLAARSGDKRCDNHPWWARSGDSTFVYGTVDPAISEITVTQKTINEDPVDGTPIPSEVFKAAASAPVGLYLVEVPGWCWVHIAATDGIEDPRLGPIGPLPSNDHHEECLSGTSLPSTTVAS